MIRKPTVYDCSVIELPKLQSRAGNITPVSNHKEIPFDIKRIFYIYDIPGGEDRGAHAHKECHQLLIAASGSFEIELNDGITKRTIMLNRPYYVNFKPGSELDPLRREFIKYVFSKQGQTDVLKDGFFPVPANIARKTLESVGIKAGF